MKPFLLRFAFILNLKNSHITFFTVENFEGTPSIKEPEKCQKLKWFSVDNLSETIIDDVRTTIKSYLSGMTFAEFGW